MSESTNGMRLAPNANQRNSLFSPLGRNRMTTAESAGTNKMSERRCSVMKFIMYSLSQHEEIECCADDNEDHQCKHQILLDTSGLDAAQLAAKPVCDISRTITKETIDDGQVKVIPDRGAQSLCCRSKDVQDAIDHTLVHELVNNILC